MTDAITTTVTWDDMIDAQADELADLRKQYEEVVELAEEEFGDDALQRPVPDNLGEIEDADVRKRAAFVRQAQLLDSAGRATQNRINMLETLADRLGEGAFKIKMLSAQEVMDTELTLRGELQSDDADEGALQQQRNNATVDAATVDAPAGFPTDEEGDPKPSAAPNALVDSLFEQVQRFNSAGSADFRAEGFGSQSRPGSGLPASSATPNDSATPSTPSASTDETPPESGEES